MSKKNTIYSPKLTFINKFWKEEPFGYNNWLCDRTLLKYALVDASNPLWIGLSTNKPSHQEYAVIRKTATFNLWTGFTLRFKINGETSIRRPTILESLHRFVDNFITKNQGKTVYIWLEQ